MGLFGSKGKSRDEIIAEAAEVKEAPKEEKGDDSFDSGNPKVDMEITRIKAQLDSFKEIRKANSERFTRISEQVGELRGMITDVTKAMSRVEIGATKAVDLVESVRPEKLMVSVRKQDGKIEALKASIEAQNAIITDFKREMKEFRQKMNFFKGVEQISQLNNEVKQELAEIKKGEAVIERHSDKIEGIFLEVEKKFANFQKYDDVTKDLQKSFQRIQTDFEKLRVGVEKRAMKQDYIKLLGKFNDFEKHTGSVLKLLDERSKGLKGDIDARFKRLQEKLEARFNVSLADEEGGGAKGEQASSPGSAKPKRRGLFGMFRKQKEPEEHKIVEKPLEGGDDGAEKPAEGGETEGGDAAEGKAAGDEAKKDEATSPGDGKGEKKADDSAPEQNGEKKGSDDGLSEESKQGSEQKEEKKTAPETS